MRDNPDWIDPRTGDKAWTAMFDNSKIKRVVGDFSCAESRDEILAEPIQQIKQRLATQRPPKGEFDALVDRICTEQAALLSASVGTLSSQV